MKVLVTTRLSEHKYKTPEGYLVCQDAILARTGAQEYYKSEVYETFEGEDGPIMVYRNEDQVFAPNTMASFEDKPITVEHPEQSVNAENYKDLAVGHTRNVRRGTFNNQPVMIADLIITDAETIKDIESGVRTDLSCGYDCDITEGDKPEQINIRGNHVALCEQGRAGIARIIDSKSVKDYQYKGYSIQINKDGATVYKSGNKIMTFPTEKDAEEWINNKIKEESKKKEPELKKYIFTVINADDHESKISVMAENEKEARKKVKSNSRVYRILGVKVKDSATLPIEEKNKLSKYFGSISKFTPNDVDILDVVEPIKQMGFDLTREKINGWYKSPNGRYRKDYFFRVNGYKDIFMISFYIKDDGKWKVDEVIAYFTGKSEPKKDKAPVKNGLEKYVIFNQDNKLKGTTYNNYYLYGDPNKFEDFGDFTSQEEVTEYLIDNRDIKRENIIYVKDSKIISIKDNYRRGTLSAIFNQLKYAIKNKDKKELLNLLKVLHSILDNDLNVNLEKWVNPEWLEKNKSRIDKGMIDIIMDQYREIWDLLYHAKIWEFVDDNTDYLSSSALRKIDDLIDHWENRDLYYNNEDNEDDYPEGASQSDLLEGIRDSNVKDAYTYKRPASVNKSKLNELSKQLKKVNEEIGKDIDEEKQEQFKHQKYLLKEKLINEIKNTQSEIDENAEKGLDTNIKNWYKNNYKLNDKINQDATFNNLFDALNKKESVYDLLGIDDYAVIKRILQKLAELIKAPYDYVFDRWYSYEE